MKYLLLTKSVAFALMLAIPTLVTAQDFDDDIYYNPSKTAKTKTTKTKTVTYTPTPDYAPASSYSFSTNSTRDVDEYNRRYTAVADTTSTDSVLVDNYTYTRRIERFHNPDVVVSTADADIIDTYYNTPTTNVNVYVNYPSYWGYNPYSWWYTPSWRWSWAYDPWYWGSWYDWTWGYDPYWSWGWGYRPYYPGYRPYYPGYYPPHHHHHYAWAPSSPGSSRPHRPVSSGSSSGYNRRPGSVVGGGIGNISSGTGSTAGYTRPGSRGRNSSSGYNPSYTGRSNSGSYTPGYTRPGSSSGSSSGYNSGSSSRGRNYTGSSAGSTNSRRSNYNSSNDYNSNRSSNYNSGRSSSRSSGYSSGGSRGGGYSGGGHSGGGGGGRGRR